jgi:hypothetical protein
MKTLSKGSWNLALALALGATGGVVFAKGPGTSLAPDQWAMNQECVSIAPVTGATAKSPQHRLSQSCSSAVSVPAQRPLGQTTAKTPSRSDTPKLLADN